MIINNCDTAPSAPIVIGNNWDDLKIIAEEKVDAEIRSQFRTLYNLWKQYYQESNAEEDYEILNNAKNLLKNYLTEKWIPFIFKKDRYRIVDTDVYVEDNGRVIGPVMDYPSMPQNTRRIRIRQVIEATKDSHLRLV